MGKNGKKESVKGNQQAAYIVAKLGKIKKYNTPGQKGIVVKYKVRKMANSLSKH